MASRSIAASPEVLYRAFTDPELLVGWLPPAPMTGVIHRFDARVGGGYLMSLHYPSTERTFRGKTADLEDRVSVRFVELDAPRRIVEAVTFLSDDPAFAGEMLLTITLGAGPGGTTVALDFDHLPAGLRQEDNEAGARASLDQLARMVERS